MRINLASYGGKGVSEMGTDAVMWLTTLNTTLLKTANTPLMMHIHTCIHTVCGFGPETEAPWDFLVNKNHFVFICSPVSLAATCKQESAFGLMNIITDHKEASTCALHTQARMSATLLQRSVDVE